MMTLKTLASDRLQADFRITLARRAQRGFSMIELMVGMLLGLLVMVALSQLFVSVTRSNTEMAKTNAQIENGRFAIQLLRGDIVHGGYWGGYTPPFDDLTLPSSNYDPTTMAPSDVPSPCLAYNTTNWTLAYKNNLIAIPVQSYDSVPTGCSAVVVNKKANTDVFVVRHAETCVPGVGNCEADTTGKLYFQSPSCDAEISAPVQAATADTITLSPSASAVDGFYNGATIRITSGPGVNQSRVISAYNGATKVATLAIDWTPPLPNNTSSYTFGNGYVLDTSGFTFNKKNCTTTADKYKFISNIYYIRDYAVTSGDGIPTLMRSQFDLSGTTLAHQTAVPLIEGIEGFRIEFGIDKTGDVDPVTGTPTVVDYTKALEWVDPLTRDTPRNRGDGVPDEYVRCTAASPCTATAPTGTAAQLPNVAAVKLYVLARNRDITVGYTDNKTYTLGATTLGPFGDHYKRHVFSTTVRMNNISARRETP